MNLSTPVGRACRRSVAVARNRPSSVNPYIPRATFLSLTRDNPRRTTLKQGIKGGEGRKQDESDPPDDFKDHLVANARLPLPERKRIPRAPHRSPGDLLESLFEQSLAPPDVAHGSPVTKPSLDHYKNVEKLKSMLANTGDPTASWNFFVQHFGPEITTSGRHNLPSYLQSTARLLQRQVIDAKVQNPFSQTLPSCTVISTTYVRLGALHEADWADLMLGLLNGLLRTKHREGRRNEDVSACFDDILGSWNVVCTQVSMNTFVDSPVLDWSNLPELQLPMRTAKEPWRTLARLTGLLKGRRSEKLGLVAVATYILLARHCPPGQVSLKQSGEFVDALRVVIGSIDDIETVVLKALSMQALHSDLIEFVRDEWPKLGVVSDRTPSFPTASRTSQDASPSLASREFAGYDILKRIKAASRAHDIAQIDLLWLDATHLPIDVSTHEYRQGFLTSGLCDTFIQTYVTNKTVRGAIDVWSHMISQGLVPSILTWSSMLNAASVSRDARMMEAIWQKMEHSGVKPDVVCWTSRVHGLIECNKGEAALRALDDMGRRWVQAVVKTHGDLKNKHMQTIGDMDDIPKPSIETINAAITGFIRRKDPEQAYRVLGWAAKFCINPDVTTYNILLRPLIKEGRAKKAAALLGQMHKAGLQADIVTFTIILDEILRTSESSTPEALKETISEVFKYMDEIGVQATPHTYTKLIHHMLQAPAGGFLAVNAIMDRMSQQELKPSPYVYTTLVQHYANEQPPNLVGITSIVERARQEHANLDQIFWDRVIEGYARAGDTASAMRALGKLNSQGGFAGWYALRTVLSALAEGEEWEAAKTLVRNTKADHGGPLPNDVQGREGQHQFWRLAFDLMLIEG